MYQDNLWLKQVDTKDLINELIRREKDDPNLLEKLKKGIRCLLCGKLRRANGYNINLKLTKLLEQIGDYCEYKQVNTFTAKQVFKDDVYSHKQYHKLKKFGLIETMKSEGWWKLKQLGSSFLKGNSTIPYKVWIYTMYDGEHIVEDDKNVSISQVDPDWKVCSKDHKSDYIPERYHIAKLI